MAGAGYKLFNTGDVLTAAQVNTYLQEQTVMVFADAAARTTALSGVLSEGMTSYLKDTNSFEVYDGSSWVSASGDLTALTAGTGISISSATGPVPTVTNSMATEITAAGDIIVGTGSGTFDNLPIGTTGQILTADTTVSPYKVKWAAAASSIPANDSATVAATQSTTSTTYTDLTTAGPAVTVTTGTKALVIITAQIYNSSSAAVASMSYAVSGATTTAASDTTRLLNVTASTTNDIRASAANVETLTAGSNTFTAKYKCGASGTAYFGDRSIIVINLA